MQKALRIIVFQAGDLVQVYTTEWVHTLASIKILILMWSIPCRIVTWKLKSYTLETLDGIPLSGVYGTRWLHAFHPCEGTKEELAQLEVKEGNLDLDLGKDFTEVGLGEVGDSLSDHNEGITTRRGGGHLRWVWRLYRMFVLVWYGRMYS